MATLRTVTSPMPKYLTMVRPTAFPTAQPRAVYQREACQRAACPREVCQPEVSKAPAG